MQQDVAKKQAEFETREFTSSSGGGAVCATVQNKILTSLTIKPEVIDPDDTEMLADLVLAAVAEAMRQSEEAFNGEMGALTGGMPGIL